MVLKSYTATTDRKHGTVSEFYRLWRRSKKFSPQFVTDVLGMVRRAESDIAETLGRPLEGCRMLEIGVGQLPRQLSYFALKNDVIGIDLDVIELGWNPIRLINMSRNNGNVRTLKTIGRKLLGFDRKFQKEMRKQLNIRQFPPTRIMRMDAAKTSFEDAQFDVVYSFNVFEHLPDPAAVLEESKRILKPGGVIFAHAHLFTSHTGCHDLRLGFSDGVLPYWPHLRAETAELVQPSAYINRIRLPEWRRIFEKHLPGGRTVLWETPAADEKAEFRKLREAGLLPEYADEELLSRYVVGLWKKPS